MDDVTQMRVASLSAAVVGVWLLVSPLVISISGGALVSTLIVAGVLVLARIVQIFWENTIPSWVCGLTTIWMSISVVAFSMSGALLWSTLAAAAAVFLLALWDGVEVDQVAHHHAHL